ncbi:MAG: GNAT family N-acetyltransferase [Planctomycetes bacterium]|nr:GNAT family N-acetyltransferase [Planctomycetota bacterium]
MSDRFQITPCPAAQRPDALRLLHEGLDEDQQTTLVYALNETAKHPEDAFEGLLVADAFQGGCGQGVVWVQLAPGSTAVIWRPAISSPAAVALLEAAADFLDLQEIALAQALANPESPSESDLLSAGGFQKLACLTYLTLDKEFFPSSQPVSELQFQSHASDDPDRLGKLLLRTYEETQDCPELNGVRQPTDVLEGYAAQGTFSAEHWFFVRLKDQEGDQDVGTLILTEHAGSENWELVYMGVTPSGRGKGLGWQIVQFALWQAARGGAQRLVLAVDEANEHALAVYRKAGFVVWDRKTVFVRLGGKVL